jgi:hypothetical protein
MSKWIRRLLATTGVTSVLVALLVSPATSVAASDKDPLAAVRHATAKFHTLTRAEAAGYGKLLACFDRPGVGGMGQHYVKAKLLDGTLAPTQPQALVYEVDGEELNLVAVEYIVPYTVLPSTSPAPMLFGHRFFQNDTLQLWALHAWIWRKNPLGTFANYNPNVALCPGHGESN